MRTLYRTITTSNPAIFCTVPTLMVPQRVLEHSGTQPELGNTARHVTENLPARMQKLL